MFKQNIAICISSYHAMGMQSCRLFSQGKLVDDFYPHVIYKAGDSVLGTRADGTQMSYLVAEASSYTGAGQDFDRMAALPTASRRNKIVNPGTQGQRIAEYRTQFATVKR